MYWHLINVTLMLVKCKNIEKKRLVYSLQIKTMNRTKKSSHWNTKSQKQTGSHIQWSKVTQSIPWTYEI